MNESSWKHDWRPTVPSPDFARRVVLELQREERWGAQAPGRRRAFGALRGSPLALLSVAALSLAGAALAALGHPLRSEVVEAEQEASPTVKLRSEPLLVHPSTRPAPMEPEPPDRELVELEPSARRKPPTPTAVETAPERPRVPVHIPRCECSTSAVVCSCVD